MISPSLIILYQSAGLIPIDLGKAFYIVSMIIWNQTLVFYWPQHSLENYHAHKIQSFMQSLMAVVESALHNVYCPLGGLVMLAALWNKAFQQFSQRVRAIVILLPYRISILKNAQFSDKGRQLLLHVYINWIIRSIRISTILLAKHGNTIILLYNNYKLLSYIGLASFLGHFNAFQCCMLNVHTLEKNFLVVEGCLGTRGSMLYIY